MNTKEEFIEYDNPEEDPVFWKMLFNFGRKLRSDGYKVSRDCWKNNYNAYITSDPWKSLVKRIKEERGNKCQLCGEENCVLHVHHNTYERLGKELDNDLVVLCSSCHNKFHKEY